MHFDQERRSNTAEFAHQCELADTWSRRDGDIIEPTDTIRYASQIQSLLAQAQIEKTNRGKNASERDDRCHELIAVAKIMLHRMIEAAQQNGRTSASPSGNAKAEALLAEFFPSTNHERGFYSTFEPSPNAMEIDPLSAEGRILLNVLGLQFNPRLTEAADSIGYFLYGTEWQPITPTLLRINEKIFAGYWDGDGVAVMTGASGLWYETHDVKCDYEWDELTNAQIDQRVHHAQRTGS